MIFATGESQLETLRALTSIPGLPWEKVSGFHLDEYIDIERDIRRPSGATCAKT